MSSLNNSLVFISHWASYQRKRLKLILKKLKEIVHSLLPIKYHLQAICSRPHSCIRTKIENHIFFILNLVIVIVKLLSHVQLFATPWTVDCQAPLTIGFSRQGYWSGLPCPSPGGLPDPGIETRSPALQVDALPSELPGKPPFKDIASNSEDQKFR